MPPGTLSTERPLRSALYVPGSKPRALEKSRDLAADALIFDLEDAVLPDEKVAARHRVAETLAGGGFGQILTVVRINGLSTPWSRDDLAAVAGSGAQAVLLPKIASAAEVAAVAEALPATQAVWAMIETPAGVLAAPQIAAAPRLSCLVLGTNDLAADLGARPGPGRAELQTSLQTCVLAARAAGGAVLDGVFNAYKDTAGLLAECQQARALGFDGKTLIHPGQIATANAVFGPAPDDIVRAERQIAAFRLAEADGQAVAVLDGQIVENLHVEAAERLLARKAAIDALEAERAS